MTMFEDREKAAERKFEREQELGFRIKARRNKLLGLWAAGHMGLAGEAAQRYAQTIVDAEVTGHDDQAIIEKVRDDLIAGGAPTAEEHIRAQLAALGVEARAQLLRDGGAGTEPSERR
ncbi:MAG TPA: DUF1476 domain-containing protein [Stellaceae bacterium]|nr:DUF1476 domain-containing protein [Stellaceae bacterium]